MHIQLSVRTPARTHDVVIEAPPGTAFGQLRPLLGFPREQTIFSSGRPLADADLMGGPGLRRGALLQLHAERLADDSVETPLRIHVVGGPDSGTVRGIRRGRLVIGRDETCDLPLSDPEVSRLHLLLEGTDGQVLVRDLGSTHGAQLDGAPVGATARRWRPGATVRIGASTLELVDTAGTPAILECIDGTQRVRPTTRPPAVAPPPPLPIPTSPARSTAARLQPLAMALPAAGGVALALLMHSLEFLLLACLSPLMMIGAAVGDRFGSPLARRREAALRGQDRTELAAERERRLASETRQRRDRYPDPATLRRCVDIPESRLWERRRYDPDHLEVRLGLASQPAQWLQLRGEPSNAAPLIDVPWTASLQSGPLALCGPTRLTQPVAGWLIAQLAILHSPADLDFSLLLAPRRRDDWHWLRWLPHLATLRPADLDPGAGVARLQRLFAARMEQRSSAQWSGTWAGEWTVVIVDLDGSPDGIDLAGLAAVLASGPTVGITAIVLAPRPAELPARCPTTARVDGETGAIWRTQAGDDDSCGVVIDQVSPRWLDHVARRLAPLVDAASSQTGIPDSCRLLDLLQAGRPSLEQVLSRWRQAPGPRTVVGRSSTAAFCLDLVRDGPHLLVAGTTGAGKSEFLQTLVAGFALANSPADLAFLLIDYKGGAAFADCARLPHVAGLVTDLDRALTERVLRSLEAELKRRETVLAGAGLSSLDAYRASEHHRAEPLERLVLVVDEFAALAEELPDFLPGLVSVAQRGRSLGVHLVLATQRPGPAVTADIRANTSLRVALRTTSAAESSDIVGVGSAARIDQGLPGRAFVRAGSQVTQVQIAQVGARTPAVGDEISVRTVEDWDSPAPPGPPDEQSATDLSLIVDLLIAAARKAAAPPVRRPWMPPLTSRISLAELGTAGTTALEIGLVDEPARQRQPPLTFDLDAGGVTLLAGGARSGRTSILRTIAGAAAAHQDPSRLHIYGLDCAGSGLAALTQLPHCATVAERGQPATLARVLQRLTADMAVRHSGPDALPHVLLLVDGWEAMVSASDEYDLGQSTELLLALARESASTRVNVVVAGGRGTLTSRLGAFAAQKYVLRLPDPSDYAIVGLNHRMLPNAWPPGRAVRVADAAEVQFAHCGPEPSTRGQLSGLESVAHKWPRLPAEHGGPWRVVALPTRVALTALPPAPAGLTLGVGGDGADPVLIDLWAGARRWLICGPGGSGRTTALCSLLSQSLAARHSLLVAAPRRSALAAQASSNGVELITPDAPPDHTLAAAKRAELILVDDSEDFLDTAAGDALVERSSTSQTCAFVVAGRTDDVAAAFRGLASVMRRSRSGVLLQPGPGDGEIFGVRLPRVRSQPIAGRGVLVSDQHGTGPIAVQLAQP